MLYLLKSKVLFLVFVVGNFSIINHASAAVVPPDVQVRQSGLPITAQVNQSFNVTYTVTQDASATTPLTSTGLTVELYGAVAADLTGSTCSSSGVNPLAISCNLTIGPSTIAVRSFSITPTAVGEIYSVASVTGNAQEVSVDNNISQSAVNVAAENLLLTTANQSADAGNVRALLPYDFDNQNGDDLLVVTDTTGYVLLNDGSGALLPATDQNYSFVIPLPTNVTKIVAANVVDGDEIEFVMSTGSNHNFEVYQLRILDEDLTTTIGSVVTTYDVGTPVFFYFGTRILVSNAENTVDFALVDLDRDLEQPSETARLELITVNAGSALSAVQAPSGDLYLGLIVDTSELSNSDSRSVALADFNNDNVQDIVLANYNASSEVFISAKTASVNNLKDRIRLAQTIELGSRAGSLQVVAGDLDDAVNGLPDIVIARVGDSGSDLQRTDLVELFSNTGSGAFAAADVVVRSNGFDQMFSQDIDGDSDNDLLIHNKNGSNLLLINQDGVLTPADFAVNGHADSIMTLIDLNGDNRKDLIVGSRTGAGLQIFLTPVIGDNQVAGFSSSSGGSGSLPWGVLLIFLVALFAFRKTINN